MNTPILAALNLELLYWSLGRREPSGEDGDVSRPSAANRANGKAIGQFKANGWMGRGSC